MILHLAVWQRILFVVLGLMVTVKRERGEKPSDTWPGVAIRTMAFLVQMGFIVVGILG